MLVEKVLWYDAGMTTLAITLRDEDGFFLEEAVKSGRYLTKSEAVAEAVSELRVREALRQERIADLHAQVMVGIKQADRGEFVKFSAREVITDARSQRRGNGPNLRTFPVGII